MAGKRSATSELDHNNWDAEEEPEERGVFRAASKEELQRRVIRTGRRRMPAAGSTQDKKSIFSGFSGFNKPAPSSFDFLSNLTNGAGSSAANGSSTTKESSPSGMFGIPSVATSTALGTSPSNEGTKTGLFGAVSQTSTNEPKSFFEKTNVTSSTSSIFNTTTVSSGGTSSENKPMFSFGTSPSSPATSNPTNFGVPSTSSPTASNKIVTFTSPSKNTSPVTSSPTSGFMFGIPPKTSETASKPTDSSDNKPILKFGSLQTSGAKSGITLGIPSNSSTPMHGFQLPVASTPNMFNAGSSVKSTVSNIPSVKRTKSDDSEDTTSSGDKKTQYYSKLKGLNESVSEWIRKHVNENPLCILTPIFKDYEKYLKELGDESNNKISTEVKPSTEAKEASFKTSMNAGASLFTSTTAANENLQKPTGFSLASAATAVPFSFGNTTTPFGAAASSAPSPFSFGIGSTFNSNSQTLAGPSEEKKNQDEDDEPPKVDFTPVAEENSVFDKRCKIFVKKDGNFVDKGVGTLYIKTIENSLKHQLLVRANTTLGTVLLNFILSDSVPTQRMGKNNVMVVCVPTPEAKPPPVPILIRVKSSEEADSLLETLEKYKK